MDFLTPQVFNILVIANLIVGLALIAYRFTKDMTRPIENAAQQREQQYDESSTNKLADTQPHQADEGIADNPAQQMESRGD